MGTITKQGFSAVAPSTQVGDLSNGAPEDLVLWNRQAALLDQTELICALMKEEGVTRADLAKRMGTTKGNITQMLDGSRNLTIFTISDVLTHLGHEYRASCKAREEKRENEMIVRVVAAEIRVPMRGTTCQSHTVNPEAFKAVIQSGPDMIAGGPRRFENAVIG